ncbi:MAG: protein rep [Planctomycetota bacterium]|nr:protein rep [Planctomycetota bacterium]
MSTDGETTSVNPYKAYRPDMQRMADMLEAAALINGPVRNAGEPRVQLKHSSLGFIHNAIRKVHDGQAATFAAGARRVAMESPHRQLKHNGHAPDLDVMVPVVGAGARLAKRAWSIRLCGRHAMGVATLNDSKGQAAGERVFHAPCRDRLCPACQARLHAHAAAVYSRLIQEQLQQRGRLFFWTLTVRHKLTDSLKSTRKALDRAWALFIRRKLFRETWSERLRIAEVEFTKDNGWHCHFHGLALLDPGSKAAHWPKIELERRMKEAWLSCTGRQGRASYAVDFRELVPHRRDADGNVTHVRYWIRPADRQRMERQATRGKAVLFRGGAGQGHDGHLYRVQPVADLVSELTKYVTKRQADGVKPNQLSLWDWTPGQVHEYAAGVAGWNLRRASAGWADLLKGFHEDELLAREIEGAKAEGYDYYSWAEIVDDCKRGYNQQLTRQELQDFAVIMPRILKALDREGCDLAADQMRGWVAAVLAPGTDEPRQKLQITPWQRHEHHAETASRRMARQGFNGLHARHYRVLLHLSRQQRQGRQVRKLRRFNMSNARLESTLHDLAAHGCVEISDGCLQLTGGGRGLLDALSSRKHRDAMPKPEARKQYELWRAKTDGG